MKNTILVPETESLLTPEEFSATLKSRKEQIERVRVQPPVLGRRGFGGVIVKWKYPRLRRRLGAVEAK